MYESFIRDYLKYYFKYFVYTQKLFRYEHLGVYACMHIYLYMLYIQGGPNTFASASHATRFLR